MKIIVFVFSFVICFFSFKPASAQNQKEMQDALDKAGSLYENGTVDEIPALLNKYIHTGFSRKQNKEALKLIVLSYLFDDYQQEARTALQRLLKSFPEFKAEKDDPVELVYLLEQFDRNINLTVGISGGINSNKPAITTSYFATGITSEKTVVSGTGNQFGVQVSKTVYKGLDIRMDINYSTYSFGFEQPTDVNTKTKYTEDLSELNIPLWLVYNFNIGEHRIYVRAGGGINGMIESNADVKLDALNESFDITSQRSGINYFAGGGFGFDFKVPTGFIQLDVGYNSGIANLVNDGERHSVSELEDTYYFAHDDFTLNNVTVTLGYVFLFYKITGK